MQSLDKCIMLHTKQGNTYVACYQLSGALQLTTYL